MDQDGHGTHCAGTIAGFNGNYSDPGTGMAPKAKLAVVDTSKLGDRYLTIYYPSAYQEDFTSMGVGVVSNSWGSDGLYNDYSKDIDHQARANPSQLWVFAGESVRRA